MTKPYSYNYEEVSRFFKGQCFKMSEVRGAVIFDDFKDLSDIKVGEDFRVGPYIFYCHGITEKYVIGSFVI